MEFGEITTLIGSFGFPIVMTLMMFYYMTNTSKELTDAVNNLSKLITELSTRVSEIGDDM